MRIDDGHLDETDLNDLAAWRLPAERSRRIVAHLAGACAVCVARFQARLEWQERGGAWVGVSNGAGAGAYEGAVLAAMIRSHAAARAEQAMREAGAALWEGLRESPPGRRVTVVLNSRRYRTAGVVEALLRDYRVGGWREPREGLALAELAVALAERVEPGGRSAERLADLRGEAQAIAADALRLAGRAREAAKLLVQAARTLAAGSGDPLLEGMVLRCAGGIWRALRQPRRTVAAFRRAEQVYRRIGELHLAAQAMVARSEAIGHFHPEWGLRLVRRAIPAIDGKRDPELELSARHGLAWYLNDAGQGLAARAEVARNAELYHRGGDAARCSRAWLEGRIGRSLYELDGARRWYERAWAGFAELEMPGHLTMLAIDRAELQVAAGEPAAAAALLGKTMAMARGVGAAAETRRALGTLRAAVAAGRGERGDFRRAALAVRRSWAVG